MVDFFLNLLVWFCFANGHEFGEWLSIKIFGLYITYQVVAVASCSVASPVDYM